MTTLIALPFVASASVVTATALGARGLNSLVLVTLSSAAMALGIMEVLA